jgi:hypothetical protein
MTSVQLAKETRQGDRDFTDGHAEVYERVLDSVRDRGGRRDAAALVDALGAEVVDYGLCASSSAPMP